MTKEQQELMFGRTRGNESLKLKPRPEDSHITRTDIKENGVELKTVRQSMPWGGIREHGLFFLSYANQIHKFDKQLQRMIGNEGPHDQLLKYSKPVTGNFWYIPSLDELAKLDKL
jgi:putative iron-dependent peroxidase